VSILKNEALQKRVNEDLIAKNLTDKVIGVFIYRMISEMVRENLQEEIADQAVMKT
jgi:hypothetical protein